MLIMVFNISCGSLNKSLNHQMRKNICAAARDVILNTDTWISNVRYGFSGELENRAAASLRVLLKEPDARSIFMELLSKAPPAGQLYVLCGLYRIDRPAFSNIVGHYLTLTNTIPTIHADVEWTERICDIVRSPRVNTDRAIRAVLAPGETLDDWVAKNIRGQTQFFFVDIEGGAYTSRFLDQQN